MIPNRATTTIPARNQLPGPMRVWGLVVASGSTVTMLAAGGGGAMLALSYVGVSLLFPEPLWPRILALVSGVWGVSALVGPLVGGVLASVGRGELTPSQAGGLLDERQDGTAVAELPGGGRTECDLGTEHGRQADGPRCFGEPDHAVETVVIGDRMFDGFGAHRAAFGGAEREHIDACLPRCIRG